MSKSSARKVTLTEAKAKEAAVKPAPEAKEAKAKDVTPAPIRYCLSGSGKVVKGKKAKFAMGGDSTLKSRILKGDLGENKEKGYTPLSKEALEHARHAWPTLFDSNGNPLPATKQPKQTVGVKKEKAEQLPKTEQAADGPDPDLAVEEDEEDEEAEDADESDDEDSDEDADEEDDEE